VGGYAFYLADGPAVGVVPERERELSEVDALVEGDGQLGRVPHLQPHLVMGHRGEVWINGVSEVGLDVG
jgi:hypothetical protein